MQPHQQRVVDEKQELDAKIAALTKFINGEIFLTVPQDERVRLDRQHHVMIQYSAILDQRIAAFGGA